MKNIACLILTTILVASCTNQFKEKEPQKETDYFSLITDRVWLNESDGIKFQDYLSSKDSIEYSWSVYDLWNDETFPFVEAKGTPETNPYDEDSDTDYVEGWSKLMSFKIEGDKIIFKSIPRELLDEDVSDNPLLAESQKITNELIEETNDLKTIYEILKYTDTIIDEITYNKLYFIDENKNNYEWISLKK